MAGCLAQALQISACGLDDDDSVLHRPSDLVPQYDFKVGRMHDACEPEARGNADCGLRIADIIRMARSFAERGDIPVDRQNSKVPNSSVRARSPHKGGCEGDHRNHCAHRVKPQREPPGRIAQYTHQHRTDR